MISAISFEGTDELGKLVRPLPWFVVVWTCDVSKARKLATSIRAGSVCVHCYQAMDPTVPFGCYEMSGYGRESGKEHVKKNLNNKAVWIKMALSLRVAIANHTK